MLSQYNTSSRVGAMAAAGLASILLLEPSAAHAATCGKGFEFVLPAGEAAPSNSKVWIGLAQFEDTGCESIELRHEGVSVDVDCSAIEVRGQLVERLLVLEPQEELTPGERYFVNGVGAEHSFVVEAITDDEPPDLPDVQVSPSASGASLDFTGFDDDSEGLIVVDADGGAKLSVDTMTGRLTSATTRDSAFIHLGARGECVPRSWPGDEDIEPGSTAIIKYGVFDLAGNFSGWSEPEVLTVKSGCTVNPSQQSGNWPTFALVLLLLVSTRRGENRGL